VISIQQTNTSTIIAAWGQPLTVCSTVRSQASSQGAAKYTPSTLTSTLPWTLSSTLPRTHSSTLPIALDCTLPACFTVHSQVSSQDTPEYTSQSLSGTLPIALNSTLPISLDNMLPCVLLHARFRDLMNCRRQAPGGVRLGAYGRRCLVVGGVWRAACGVWHAAYVGRNHDVG
jgi:hypothetical protein